MNGARKYRELIHEAARFGVVGGLGVVVTDGGTNLLRDSAGLGWLTANVIATLVAIEVTYLGSRYWTFRHRARNSMPRETLLFFALAGGGIADPARMPRIHRARAGRVRPAGRERGPAHRHRAGHRVPLLGLPEVGLAGG